jgi:hypothetical protein
MDLPEAQRELCRTCKANCAFSIPDHARLYALIAVYIFFQARAIAADFP